jgi:hypothetical protein
MSALKITYLSLVMILLSSMASAIFSDVTSGLGAGSALSHPRVRILDPNGEPIEDVTIAILANGTFYTGTTSSSGWAVFEDFDGEKFPPGSGYAATKEGYRTIEWSQGDPVPPMLISREDDTILVILLIALTVLSVLILLVLSFKGRPKKERDSYNKMRDNPIHPP